MHTAAHRGLSSQRRAGAVIDEDSDRTYGSKLTQMGSMPPTNGLMIGERNVQIRYGSSVCSMPCNIYFNLIRQGTLLFEPKESVSSMGLEFEPSNPFTITLPDVPEPVECYLVHSQLSLSTQEATTFIKLIPRFSLLKVDHAVSLIEVHGGVVNFRALSVR